MFIFSSFGEILKDAVLPPLCAVCGSLCGTPLCDSCSSKIKFLGDNICARCGSPVKSGFDKNISTVKICSLCKNEKYCFYMARSYAYYNSEIAKVIHKFKYRKFYYLKEVILYFLRIAYEYYYSREKIDFIETVPSFHEYRDNIYNLSSINTKDEKDHMQMISEKLSVCLNIPYGDNIIKIKQTPRQQELDRDLRKINLKDSFKIKNSLKVQGKNILLIDDVFTTGSTLNEISRQLKNTGAERIYLLTVARGA